MIDQMLLLSSTAGLPRRIHSRQNFFTVMYQIHIQVLMMNIYEVDMVAKSNRGEVRRQIQKCVAKYPLNIQS